MHAAPEFPGQGDGMFITDAGIETVLMFLEQTDLPHFAAKWALLPLSRAL